MKVEKVRELMPEYEAVMSLGFVWKKEKDDMRYCNGLMWRNGICEKCVVRVSDYFYL